MFTTATFRARQYCFLSMFNGFTKVAVEYRKSQYVLIKLCKKSYQMSNVQREYAKMLKNLEKLILFASFVL